MMAVMIVIGRLARPVLELLDHWPGRAFRTFALQRRMSDVKLVVEQLLEITDNFTLAQAIVWFDIDMCRQRRDV